MVPRSGALAASAMVFAVAVRFYLADVTVVDTVIQRLYSTIYKSLHTDGGCQDRKSICLSTLLYNEKENIIEWVSHLPEFDGYVVCDLNSHDGTPYLASAFFEQKGLNARVLTNMSSSSGAITRKQCIETGVKFLRKQCDYWLLLDGPKQTIQFGNSTSRLPCDNLGKDSYWLEENFHGTVYATQRLIKASLVESLVDIEPQAVPLANAPNDMAVLNSDLIRLERNIGHGSFSRQEALELEVQLLNSSLLNGENQGKLQFYLGNALNALGKTEEALESWLGSILYQGKDAREEAYASALSIAQHLEHTCDAGTVLSDVFLEKLKAWLPDATLHLAFADVVAVYHEISNILKYRKEAPYHIARIQRTKLGNNTACYASAIDAFERGPHTHSTIFSDDRAAYSIDDELCACSYYAGRSLHGIEACRRLIQTWNGVTKMHPDGWQQNLLARSSGNEDYYKKVMKIEVPTNELPFFPVQNESRINIVGGIIATYGEKYFRVAFHSYLQRCLDCGDLVNAWFAGVASSDGSSNRRFASPGFMHLLELSSASGLEIIRYTNALIRNASQHDYLLYLDDSWFFMEDEFYLSRAVDIMDTDPNVAQVLFNDNYRELDLPEEYWKLLPSEKRVTRSGQMYGVHKYVGEYGSPKWIQAHKKIPNQNTHQHWPHFSLRPGLWRLSAIRQVGLLNEVDNYEYEYALRYASKGYITAFLPGFYALHLKPSLRIQSWVAKDPISGSKDLMAPLSHFGVKYLKQLPSNCDNCLEAEGIQKKQAKVLIYILHHDEGSENVAHKTFGARAWARIKRIPSTKYLDSVMYATGFFNEFYDEWKDVDYVGTLSWKSHSKIDIPNIGALARYLGSSEQTRPAVVSFYQGRRSMLEDGSWYHPRYVEIWVTLLRSLGYSDEIIFSKNIPLFYSNYWMASPEWMQRYIEWAIKVRHRMESLASIQDALWSDATYYFPDDRFLPTFEKPYYTHHFTVFERFPGFFFWVEGASIEYI